MDDSEKNKKLEDFELYQKRYDFLFRRCPEEDKKELFEVLYEPKKRKKHKYLKNFVTFIDESKKFFELGGTAEDLEKKDKKYLEDKKFDLEKIRKHLLEMLIHLIEQQEDFSSKSVGGSNYFNKKNFSTGEIVTSGVRNDKENDQYQIHIGRLELQTGKRCGHLWKRGCLCGSTQSGAEVH